MGVNTVSTVGAHSRCPMVESSPEIDQPAALHRVASNRVDMIRKPASPPWSLFVSAPAWCVVLLVLLCGLSTSAVTAHETGGSTFANRAAMTMLRDLARRHEHAVPEFS